MCDIAVDHTSFTSHGLSSFFRVCVCVTTRKTEGKSVLYGKIVTVSSLFARAFVCFSVNIDSFDIDFSMMSMMMTMMIGSTPAKIKGN